MHTWRYFYSEISGGRRKEDLCQTYCRYTFANSQAQYKRLVKTWDPKRSFKGLAKANSQGTDACVFAESHLDS